MTADPLRLRHRSGAPPRWRRAPCASCSSTAARSASGHTEDDEWGAIDNVCTHDGGVLGDGELEGDAVECPRHGGRFDLFSRARAGPAAGAAGERLPRPRGGRRDRGGPAMKLSTRAEYGIRVLVALARAEGERTRLAHHRGPHREAAARLPGAAGGGPAPRPAGDRHARQVRGLQPRPTGRRDQPGRRHARPGRADPGDAVRRPRQPGGLLATAGLQRPRGLRTRPRLTGRRPGRHQPGRGGDGRRRTTLSDGRAPPAPGSPAAKEQHDSA